MERINYDLFTDNINNYIPTNSLHFSNEIYKSHLLSDYQSKSRDDFVPNFVSFEILPIGCLLYTSDAADD